MAFFKFDLRSLLIILLPVSACVMPPAPRTIPASGIAGAPRASMTSSRVHGENPFRDAYWAVDDAAESGARAKVAGSMRMVRAEVAAD